MESSGVDRCREDAGPVVSRRHERVLCTRRGTGTSARRRFGTPTHRLGKAEGKQTKIRNIKFRYD